MYRAPLPVQQFIRKLQKFPEQYKISSYQICCITRSQTWKNWSNNLYQIYNIFFYSNFILSVGKTYIILSSMFEIQTLSFSLQANIFNREKIKPSNYLTQSFNFTIYIQCNVPYSFTTPFISYRLFFFSWNHLWKYILNFCLHY